MDITVEIQPDGSYIVYGRDAAALYEKMQQIPIEARNLELGELKDGAFAFILLYDLLEAEKKIEKPAAAMPASARGYSEPTTIAIAV